MKQTFLLLLGVAVLSACKKDSEPAPSASRTDLLTSHKWKPVSGTITLSLLGTPQSSSIVEACNKDDSYTFSTTKSLIVDAGATKCSTSDPQQQTGSWALSSNDQKLTLNLPSQGISGDLDINELTTTTLHVSGTQNLGGLAYTVDLTLTAN